MKQLQLYQLTLSDLSEPVVVTTRLASSFVVERTGQSFIARNRTEWASGYKFYPTFAELKKDLARR